MIKLYKWIENIWFKHLPQKMRFLLVGGFNTVAAYLIFIGLYYAFNKDYALSVVVQYFISINISIITMRHYVFQSKGSFKKEYLKAAGVYIYLLFFNVTWLFIFVDTCGMNALASQALYLIVSTIITYIMHKYFSFKK